MPGPARNRLEFTLDQRIVGNLGRLEPSAQPLRLGHDEEVIPTVPSAPERSEIPIDAFDVLEIFLASRWNIKKPVRTKSCLILG